MAKADKTELTPQSVAKEVVMELKKQGLIKDNRSAFQKTETLLYHYKSFKETIENKLKQIDTIKKYGGYEKSSSITAFSSSAYIESKTELEKAEDQITKIEQSMIITQNFITIIDDSISKFKNDPYYDIINLKYFEKKTREEIAEIMECDVSTITRNKNRIINRLKIELFSDTAILEMVN